MEEDGKLFKETAEPFYKEIHGEGKWRQIWIAFAVCYVCICGGNLVGYTSSAIPSIREGKSSWVPFLRFLHEQSSFAQTSNSGPTVAHRVQEIDQVLHDIDQEETRGVHVGLVPVPLTDAEASWIGGLTPLGAFFGSLAAPFPIRSLGPKGSLLKLAGPGFLLSWLITALAPSLMYIYGARLLGGLVMGLTFSSVPIYIMETTSMQLRGPLGTLSQFLFTVGVLMNFVVGYLLDWRSCALVSTVVVLPAFILLCSVPESPAWLMSKKKRPEALSAFKFIRGYSITSELEYLHEVDSDNEHLNKMSSTEKLYRKPATMRSIFVAFFLCIFQQLTGINAVNFYTVSIFESAAGESSFINGHLSAIVVALVFCLANICSYFLIEKVGRKVLLLISTFFLSLSAFSLGTYFYARENGYETSPWTFVPLTSLVVFVLAFSIGYGPLLYVLIAEILPKQCRTTVTPVAVGINWLCVFLVAKTFPTIIHVFKVYGAFWMYGIFSGISLMFTILYVPETKEKTEAEIAAFFEYAPRHVPRKASLGDKIEPMILTTERLTVV